MSTRNSVGQIALIGSAALHASLLLGTPLARPVARAESARGPEIEVAIVSPGTRPAEDAANDITAARPRAPGVTRRTASRVSPRTASLQGEPVAANVAAPMPPASPASGAPPAPFHFVVSVAPATSAGPALGASEGAGGIVYAEDGIDAPPRLLTWQAPQYPPAAASAGVEVDVPVDLVIDTEGSVTEVRLPKHFGYGLDEAAVAAARSYRFSRGLRAGRPVRVRMRCTVVFRLN